MLVIRKSDMDVDAVSIRVHGKGNLGAKPRSEAIAEILQTSDVTREMYYGTGCIVDLRCRASG